MYKYFQPNKKDIKDIQGDCVIRSFCKVTGKAWLNVFDEMVPIARDLQAPLNGKDTYQAYLKSQGFTYYGISNKKGSKRPTVKSFSSKNKGGVYVLVLANHLVASEGGHYFDTWDSGEKCLYGYWKKEGAE